jgi:UDPglucose 6-dehydrogenase
MKVCFINEMADVCEAVGADVTELAKGMGLDSRIGEKFLSAGPGIGGSCFPKDGRALAFQSRELGTPSRVIEAFIKANEERKINLARRIAKKVGSGTIAIFGLTFKAKTNDMRESPSITIIEELQKHGLKIKAYDPEGLEEAENFLHDVGFCQTPQDCANNADAIVILTEWDEFKKLDYKKLKPRKKIIFDFRNILAGIEPKGFEYFGVGRN